VKPPRPFHSLASVIGFVLAGGLSWKSNLQPLTEDRDPKVQEAARLYLCQMGDEKSLMALVTPEPKGIGMIQQEALRGDDKRKVLPISTLGEGRPRLAGPDKNRPGRDRTYDQGIMSHDQDPANTEVSAGGAVNAQYGGDANAVFDPDLAELSQSLPPDVRSTILALARRK
jgi:hypothetical protein